MNWTEHVCIDVHGIAVGFDWDFDVDVHDFLVDAHRLGEIDVEYWLERIVGEDKQEELAKNYINALTEDEFLLLIQEKIPTIGE